MKFTKSVLAISIAVAVSGTAFAAAKSKDDDSVRQWGRWAVLMPAAGLQEGPGFSVPEVKNLESCQSSSNCIETAAVPPIKVVPPEPGEPPVLPPPAPPVEPPAPPVVEGHCTAGAACGYATYEYDDYSGNQGYGDSGKGAPVPAYIALNLQSKPYYSDDDVPPVAGIPADGGEQLVTADFTITPRDAHENYPTLPDRHRGPTENNFENDGSYMHWYAYGGNPYGSIDGYLDPDSTEDMTFGGYDGAEGSDFYGNMYGVYAAGTTTTMAYLDSLNAGNVEATYIGYGLRNEVDVVINIDFRDESHGGQATWNGVWNGGRDGYISNVYTDENGVQYVEGQVGFRASGHVSGPNIISDHVSADDAAQVTGSVEGSFFGSKAQALAGVSDITKTVNEGDAEYYTNGRNVDVFVTVKQDYVE